ncbi:hypothetical protein MCY_00055 [Bartonella rattimassiliensis 15908]|uniref:Uncharacterized protein n=1 Tax=Bartonella rattimassiliensis 15908 TaxID=1094556 RepID=J1JSK5_9HYPH|nr:hypothetical protein MCY_00055 [Bartonella rattimassiliensis 15908]
MFDCLLGVVRSDVLWGLFLIGTVFVALLDLPLVLPMWVQSGGKVALWSRTWDVLRHCYYMYEYNRDILNGVRVCC